MKNFLLFLTVLSFTDMVGQKSFECAELSMSSNLEIYKGMISEANLWEENLSTTVPNLGVSTNEWWVKFGLTDHCDQTVYLTVQKPSLDTIALYEFRRDSSVVLLECLGDFVPIDDRIFPSPEYIFELPIRLGETKYFALRIKSYDQIQLPMVFGTAEDVVSRMSMQNMLFGLFSGVFFVMFFYNLFLFLSTSDKSYLLYIVYILAVYLTQAEIMGFAYEYLWPECPNFERYAVVILSSLVGIAATVFFVSFLEIKKNHPLIFRIVLGFCALYILICFLALFGFESIAYQVLQLNAAVLAFVLFISTLLLAKSGSRPALYFLIAWSVFLLGVCVYVLKDYGILSYNNFTVGIMQIGSALEVILLSFALADRINQLKKDKEQEQYARIRAVEENEKMVREQNVFLESKVEERTMELRASNNELNETLQSLKSAQVQLVDSEKMASLGQMTAGIAHELNNPINFVSSNISPLKRDLDDVFEVLDKYDTLSVESENVSNILKEIDELKEDIELDYVRQEIGDLLKGIEDGAHRTSEIVKGLRVFSRLDEDALKKANINDCITSTLVILKSSLNGEVEIVQELDHAIAEVNCFPGKLNQVFMNIIVNAIQATKEAKRPQGEAQVKITTSQNENSVIIAVEDNGVGMNEDIKTHIFDPFYTTKEVGEGTGLGLSIVLGIINDHQGKIEVESEVGSGTKFLITLSKSL